MPQVLKSLRLHHFKAFENYQIRFHDSAYLVGPNNAGKSTIISVLRGASQMLRHAGRWRADVVGTSAGLNHRGYSFPASRFGLVDDNVQHEFIPGESRVEVTFTNDARLVMVWPETDWPGLGGVSRREASGAPFFYLLTA